MRSLIRFLLLCLLPMAAWAQSSLPPCPKDVKAYWPNCFGTFTFPDGAKYVGEFKDGKASGQGTYTAPDGSKYVGGFKDNKRHGYGTFSKPNGAKYVGGFSEDRLNGKGTLTNPNGERYVGEFRDNKFNGQGTYTWPDGVRYVGGFMDDNPHGAGTEYAVSGVVRQQGRWERGRLVSAEVTTDVLRLRFDIEGGSLVHSTFLKYPAAKARDKGFVLFDESKERVYLAQSGWIGAAGTSLPNHKTTMTLVPGERELKAGQDSLELRFESPEVGGLQWIKTYVLKRGAYDITVRHELINTSANSKTAQLYLQLVRDGNKPEGESGIYSTFTGPAVYTEAKKYQKVEFSDIEKNKIEHEKQTDNGYVAMVQHYFASAWLLGQGVQREVFMHKVDTNLYSVGMIAPIEPLAPGVSKTIEARLFIGPNNQEILHAVTPGLDSIHRQRNRLKIDQPAQPAVAADAAKSRQRELEERLAAQARERDRLMAEARDRDRPQSARPVAPRQERRVALVVGNAAYTNQPLANPVNDATDVAATLRAMGFETTLLRDATLAQMRNATRQFADAATSSDVALIFFAGHGIEAKGRNYVIPVGAEMKHEYELEDQAYDASRWLDMLEGIKTGNRQRVNIVILDASRNNELVRSWRSSSRGLARMDAPTGTFIAFSTAPGKVAIDGAKDERNSPFTKSLLRAIQSPDMPIELMFKEVRRMVIEETNNDQVPWDNSSLVGDFVFRRTR